MFQYSKQTTLYKNAKQLSAQLHLYKSAWVSLFAKISVSMLGILTIPS